MVDVLDLRKLRMLAELERLGTIAAVAQTLHLTAPGVSMQLAALEREVGLSLTERNGRRLTLTPAGRLLASHGRSLVEMLSLAEMEVIALQEGSAGTYRVAAFPSIARSIVADTWAILRENPELGVRIELIEMEPEDSLPALAAGEVDIALSHSYSNLPATLSPNLVTAPLASETVWLASRADPSDPSDVELAGYATADWVVPHRNWSCYEMVQRACGLAGFTPRIVAEATDFSVILALVAAGAGVALVPQLTVGQLPAGVTLRSLTVPVVRYDTVVTRQATAADLGAQRILALLADSAGRLVPAPIGSGDGH
ncbi:LysR family transcriptional regulator [Leifsonia sp. YAF41]|uniref:LysR family transcriptional regulator n=1 Tax=Leifsonia sp. YAF41 TaxID=3233086 RepID=UPI003F9DD60E